MKHIRIYSLALGFLILLSTNVKADFFSDANAFLKANVDARGMVYYKGIKEDPAKLNSLVKQIANFSYSGASDNTKKAFLINAYNILMIKSVVDHYPIAKPLDVDGIFDKTTHNVAGMKLTLSDIENKKLRVDFPDARLHFALVCGAMSCPPLMNQAYLPGLLEQQLTSRANLAMNDRTFIRVDKSTKKALISKIFEWYKEDFIKEGKTMINYINKYRREKIPSGYSLGFYTYDWSLNEKKSR